MLTKPALPAAETLASAPAHDVAGADNFHRFGDRFRLLAALAAVTIFAPAASADDRLRGLWSSVAVEVDPHEVKACVEKMSSMAGLELSDDEMAIIGHGLCNSADRQRRTLEFRVGGYLVKHLSCCRELLGRYVLKPAADDSDAVVLSVRWEDVPSASREVIENKAKTSPEPETLGRVEFVDRNTFKLFPPSGNPYFAKSFTFERPARKAPRGRTPTLAPPKQPAGD